MTNQTAHQSIVNCPVKALDAESEYGTVRVASVEDLIWMKRKRNSDQDQVDIRMLEKGKNETNR